MEATRKSRSREAASVSGTEGLDFGTSVAVVEAEERSGRASGNGVVEPRAKRRVV